MRTTDFSVEDADVDKPPVTDALQEGAIGLSKDVSAANTDVDKSPGAAILREDAVIISNDYSAADADVNRPLDRDPSKKDANITNNAMRECTSSIAYHMTMTTEKDLLFMKHSATPFQNVHAPRDTEQCNQKSNPMVAIMSQVCEPTQKRRQLVKIRKKELEMHKKELETLSSRTTSSSWTKLLALNARKRSLGLSRRSKQQPSRSLDGLRQPKKAKTKKTLVCQEIIKEKHAFPRSLSSTPHCKANDESERGMQPRNRRSLSY